MLAIACLLTLLSASGNAVAALAQDSDEAEVAGLVTLNGRLADSGTRITFVVAENREVVCGEGATDEGGTFVLALAPNCAPGTHATAQLPAVGAESSVVYAIDPSGPALLVQFTGLTDEQLALLEPARNGADVSVAEAVAEQSVRPLISEDSLTLVLGMVIVATSVVLLVMLFLVRKDRNFRIQTEGAILLAVITAIIILGVTGKVTSDGLISVLAAIVGWGAGRSQSGKSEQGADGGQPQAPQQPDDGSIPEGQETPPGEADNVDS